MRSKHKHSVFAPPPPFNNIKEYFTPILLGLNIIDFLYSDIIVKLDKRE